MASSANDDDRPGPTPVPPRGGKRKPNRPPAKRPATPAAAKGRPAAGGRPAAPGRPSAKGRPADNRRAAMAQRRRRNQTLLAAGVIVVIIAVVGVIIGVRASGGGTKSNTATGAVPASTLDSLSRPISLQAMASAAGNYSLTAVNGESASPYPQVVSATPITTGGKPEILYVGAEYCPYCATERWPLVLALSKFGTFTNLHTTHSSATDVFPNTATFSFYQSSYTSPYLTFVPVETETVTEKPLQTLTAAQNAIVGKYDSSGDIPFVYFNGKAVITGAEYSPSLLAGKSFQQIADAIAQDNSTLAGSVIADAGVIVSDICHMTGGKPGSVCRLFPKPITS